MGNKQMGRIESRHLMIGLDNAGKTTLLYQLRLDELITTKPSTSYNVESIKVGNKKDVLTIWDVGGGEDIRCLWSKYYTGTVGIVFVIDSTDHKRLGDYTYLDLNYKNSLIVYGFINEIDRRRQNHDSSHMFTDIFNLCFNYYHNKLKTTVVMEIHKILKEDEFRYAPLLIFANKRDLPDALPKKNYSTTFGV
eukprot:UN09977